jgi:hypothetical protein
MNNPCYKRGGREMQYGNKNNRQVEGGTTEKLPYSDLSLKGKI